MCLRVLRSRATASERALVRAQQQVWKYWSTPIRCILDADSKSPPIIMSYGKNASLESYYGQKTVFSNFEIFNNSDIQISERGSQRSRKGSCHKYNLILKIFRFHDIKHVICNLFFYWSNDRNLKWLKLKSCHIVNLTDVTRLNFLK